MGEAAPEGLGGAQPGEKEAQGEFWALHRRGQAGRVGVCSRGWDPEEFPHGKDGQGWAGMGREVWSCPARFEGVQGGVQGGLGVTSEVWGCPGRFGGVQRGLGVFKEVSREVWECPGKFESVQ